MKRHYLLAIGALLVTSCQDATRPVASPSTSPHFDIEDAVHGTGNKHFFFLPPLLTPAPITAGAFDGTRFPVIDICEWSGNACQLPLVASFSRTTGLGGATIVVDAQNESYRVQWDTRLAVLDPTKTYRLTVSVGGFPLGHVDLDVVSSGREMHNVATGDYIGLVDGHKLNIAFRLEQGLFPASLAIVSGDGQQGLTGGALTDPIVVSVTDAVGAVQGALVSFTVGAGGGSVSPATAVTDAFGHASAVLTLGGVPGINTVVASTSLPGASSVVFNATALGAPTNGLVASYPFDGNAQDVSGNSFHGVIRQATPTPDRFGWPDRAYRFAGEAGIALPSAVLYDMPEGTVTLWMRAETFGTGGIVITKTRVFDTNYYQLDLIGQNLLRFYLNNSDLRSSSAATVGRWLMVTTTWDGTTKHLYIDGQHSASEPSTLSVPAVDLPVMVGNGDGFYSPMYGSVDDIKIYRRALTPAEIATLYQAERVP